MKERHPQDTSIGTFHWNSHHAKWTCENSTLDGDLTINIGSMEIDFSQFKEIDEISKMRDDYFALAMKCAEAELAKYGVDPATMILSGIGLDDELFHGGFALVYAYPYDIWPSGRLTVVFQNHQPQYCHSDDQ